jgi:hypothetical protein
VRWALQRCAVAHTSTDAKQCAFAVRDGAWCRLWQQHSRRVDADGTKCLPLCVFALPTDLARNFLAGMQLACGDDDVSNKSMRTSSACVRDDLVRLMLHAGYSASFAQCSDSDDVSQWRITYDCADDAEPLIDAQRDVVRTLRHYTGRTWCFDMNDGFVVVRRALRAPCDASESKCVVTHASMPTIQGNW